VRSLAQQSSTAKHYPNSVENFCYVLEKKISITDDEQQMLRGLINFGFIVDDINSEETVKLFRGIHNEKTILIVSKTSMKNLVKSIREEPFLSAIYIIDSSKDSSFDSNLYRGSFPSVDRLCKQLEEDLPLLTYGLTLVSSISADYTSISTFNYVQTLKDILLETDDKRNLKKEMIEFCREKYANNVFQLKLIDQFEKTFPMGSAIQWYSRTETFIYKMLTRAFRILDVDILYKLRFFIQQLHRQLQSSSDNSPLTVYRTLRVPKELFKKMNSYKDAVLSFNEFFFAYKNQKTTEPCPMNVDSKLVRFQINLEAGVPRHTMAGFSNGILLTIGTVFRIDKIESIDEETFTVKLTSSNDIQKLGQSIAKDLLDSIRGPFPLVRIVRLMRQRESMEYLEYFANMLMNDLQTAENETANLAIGGALHSLGGHYYETKQYEQGLIHLQNAVDVYTRVLSPNDNRLTPTYNNIGSIYFKQNLNEKALEYHLKAYEIQKNSTNPDVDSVLAYLGNISGVLDKLGRHKEAIKYSETELKIRHKISSKKDSPQIAVKYHNLAGRQYRAQLYSEALENYQKCLEIELVCHPPDNPTVAVTYTNMATALEKLGRLKEAKTAAEKAIERLLRTKKEDDEDVQNIRKYLQQLEQRNWMKDLLATT
jgi:tetratricopeptide (TPR) repeat protein